jgi:tetratricopeptide (TPR) repeat protein
MKRFWRALPVAAVAAWLCLGLTGCNKLQARDQLNKGVQAYKNGRYEEAIEHFKNSVGLDPQLGVAKLYLATAYVGQYVPGVDTPENNRNAELAIEQYQSVLDSHPSRSNRVLALKGIASLYFNMKKFDQAKQFHQKVLDEDPGDPETYYSIGVIDWTEAYQHRQDIRNKLGLTGDAPIPEKDKKDCQDLQAQNQNLISDGMDKLNHAVSLRKDYDDAMAYLNLMYREKAAIDCGDPDARAADLKTADDWVEKTMATKRAKAEKASKQGGIVMEQGGSSGGGQQQQPQQ